MRPLSLLLCLVATLLCLVCLASVARAETIQAPVGARRGSDPCRDLKAEGGVETCTWGVPRTLPADPSAPSLRWLPAGAQFGPDTALYDAEGRVTAPEGFVIAPSRVEVLDLLPQD